MVAEGFGEDLMDVTGTDASGNKKLGDIGLFLKQEIEKWLSKKYDESTCKYIDPSYMAGAPFITGSPKRAEEAIPPTQQLLLTNKIV